MSVRLLVGFAGLLLLTQVAHAAAPPCDSLIEWRLTRPVTVSFEGETLNEVLNHLRAVNGIKIHVDKPALQAEGISLESPISLRLEGVSLKSALDLILHDVHLTYVIKGEVLEITTEAHAAAKPVVCTYEVADILDKPIPHPLNMPAPGSLTKERLIECITSTLAPSRWMTAGGEGTIEFDPKTGNMVVTQPPDIHEQILDLIFAIRRLQNQ